MKQCPACQQLYADDSLFFCLMDGTGLITSGLTEQETVVIRPQVTQPAEGEVTRPAVPAFDPPSEPRGIRIPVWGAAVGGLLVTGLVAYLFLKTTTSGGNTADRPVVVSTQPAITEMPRFTVQDALNTYEYEQGWSGGRGNVDPSNIQFFPVTTKSVIGNEVVMNYPWKDGVLRLTVAGNELKGTWHQSNGDGPIDFRFTPDFESADGSWSNAATGESGMAFLRRKH